jgi:hypothetical protein
MRKYIILFTIISISFIANAKKSSFYILNVALVSTYNEAELKSKQLKRKGYRAGFLWIPDYESLSGAKFYSIYIGPFTKQYECEVATDKYKKSFPGSYGLLVSQDSKRVQINGVGKVTVTEKSTIKTIKLKFLYYEFGDLAHYIFKDIETGEEIDIKFDYNQTGYQTAKDEIDRYCEVEGDCKMAGVNYIATLQYKFVDTYECCDELVKTGKKEKRWVLTKLNKVK